jgi:hypothetical protein
MITRIFSRSRDTIDGLTIYAEDYPTLVWFPEIRYTHGGAAPTPVHPADQIAAANRLIGKMVVTLSEYIILWFLKEIRCGRMKPEEVELYCNGKRIRIDRDGELIDKWPGGFFRERSTLLF